MGEHVVQLLGGSWVVISRVISRVTILITHIKGLITRLRTTHEPPSRGTLVRNVVSSGMLEAKSLKAESKLP